MKIAKMVGLVRPWVINTGQLNGHFTGLKTVALIEMRISNYSMTISREDMGRHKTIPVGESSGRYLRLSDIPKLIFKARCIK